MRSTTYPRILAVIAFCCGLATAQADTLRPASAAPTQTAFTASAPSRVAAKPDSQTPTARRVTSHRVTTAVDAASNRTRPSSGVTNARGASTPADTRPEGRGNVAASNATVTSPGPSARVSGTLMPVGTAAGVSTTQAGSASSGNGHGKGGGG